MLPDQARMVMTGDPELDSRLMSERFDRIPVFRPYVTNELMTAGYSTASGTLATLGLTFFPFFKDESWTDLCFTFNADLFLSSGTSTGGALGVYIDSSIAVPCRFAFINAASTHQPTSGVALLSSVQNLPLQSGAHTLQFAWRRTVGTGTMAVDSNSEWQVKVQECIPPRV